MIAYLMHLMRWRKLRALRKRLLFKSRTNRAGRKNANEKKESSFFKGLQQMGERQPRGIRKKVMKTHQFAYRSFSKFSSQFPHYVPHTP